LTICAFYRSAGFRCFVPRRLFWTEHRVFWNRICFRTLVEICGGPIQFSCRYWYWLLYPLSRVHPQFLLRTEADPAFETFSYCWISNHRQSTET